MSERPPVSAAVSPAEPRRGSTAETIIMEGNERVYPCRCGETHRGEYGATDFGHHDCFHDAPIWAVPDDPGHFVCGSCGKSFMTEERSLDREPIIEPVSPADTPRLVWGDLTADEQHRVKRLLTPDPDDNLDDLLSRMHRARQIIVGTDSDV